MRMRCEAEMWTISPFFLTWRGKVSGFWPRACGLPTLVKMIFLPSFCSSEARRYSSPRTAYCTLLTFSFSSS
uniref:Uncharacterized protein n=1 Tax=Zea mays TaxID=4577 RepID=A0A804Q3F2_MAIZE